MYVCMYVCMYVFMYVCMYVCIYIRMHVCMYVYICMYLCMHTCMHVCMYVCMYVYAYIYIGAEEGGVEHSEAGDAHGLRQEPHPPLQGLQRSAPRSGSKVSSKGGKATGMRTDEKHILLYKTRSSSKFRS
jgi:hypothetical protein